MFQHLLVPLDGSRLAETVLPMVAFLASRAGARVTLLHVVERAAPAEVHGDRHLRSAEDAEHYFERIARDALPPEIPLRWHIHRREIDDVAHSVADHADELEPDLIVMVTHGRRRVMQWIKGTIAQQVVQRTPTPVLLLHPGPEETVPVPFRQILVALDGQPEHEASLPVASDIALLSAAPLRLVMVVPTRDALDGSRAATGQLLPAATEEVLRMAEQSGEQYLARHVARLRDAGVSAAATLARGNPVDVLRQTIAKHAADLVALGTHGTAGTQAFWSGTLSQRLIGRVAASFLLAPASGPAG